ncbi:MAG: sugar phosphate isomerase/epimerase [Verrucomicrobiales bacterium]
MMKLFLSCWANELSLADAIDLAPEWGYDGVEGPADPAVAERLKESGLPYIAEIATGGGYVPKPHLSVQDHLDDLEKKLEQLTTFDPLFVNVLGGSDRWTMPECTSFYIRAQGMAMRCGQELVWETHRSRPTATPWQTWALLKELPDMQLNCDFSHWCVVCERFIMNEEPELLSLCIERARHVHLRVGYDQGPQIADPKESKALEAHLSWWRKLRVTTATPEFGPDGYAPPGQDLRAINRWMAHTFRQQFADHESADETQTYATVRRCDHHQPIEH